MLGGDNTKKVGALHEDDRHWTKMLVRGIHVFRSFPVQGSRLRLPSTPRNRIWDGKLQLLFITCICAREFVIYGATANVQFGLLAFCVYFSSRSRPL